MAWYTTADARRDAGRQQHARELAGFPSPKCSTFCAEGEPCAITGSGKCDALPTPPPRPPPMPMNEEVRKAVDELSMWVLRSGDQLSECDEWTIIVAELTRLTEIADSVDPLVVRLGEVTAKLEAANALLRDIKEWDVNAAQGTCLMVPHSLRSRIQAHLSEPRT